MNARRSLRLAVSGLLSVAWCWSLLRVALVPGRAGPLEQGIAVSGWSLSLLPVHVSLWRHSRRRAGLLTLPAAIGSPAFPVAPAVAEPLDAVQPPEAALVSRTPDGHEACPRPWAGVPAGVDGVCGGGSVPGSPLPPPRRPAFGAARPVTLVRVPAGATAMSALPSYARRAVPPAEDGAGPRWQEGHQ